MVIVVVIVAVSIIYAVSMCRIAASSDGEMKKIFEEWKNEE
jgi:hypothetical protein